MKSAALHDIYSPEVSQALKSALHQFEQRMPGFISDVGLLHGVETRTSSPVSSSIEHVPLSVYILCAQLPWLLDLVLVSD